MFFAPRLVRPGFTASLASFKPFTKPLLQPTSRRFLCISFPSTPKSILHPKSHRRDEPFVKDPSFTLEEYVNDELCEKLARLNGETPAWVVVLLFEGLEGEAKNEGCGKFVDDVWKQWERDFSTRRGPENKLFEDGVLLCFIRDSKSISVRAGRNATKILLDVSGSDELIKEFENIGADQTPTRTKQQRALYADSVQFYTESVLDQIGEGHGLKDLEQTSNCVIL